MAAVDGPIVDLRVENGRDELDGGRFEGVVRWKDNVQLEGALSAQRREYSMGKRPL